MESKIYRWIQHLEDAKQDFLPTTRKRMIFNQTMTGFLVEDCSAAIQNILLAAHGIGLGAVWCGLYPVTHLTQEVERACSLPEHILPIGMVVLGHKGEEKKIDDRYDSAKLHYEVW